MMVIIQQGQSTRSHPHPQAGATEQATTINAVEYSTVVMAILMIDDVSCLSNERRVQFLVVVRANERRRGQTDDVFE